MKKKKGRNKTCLTLAAMAALSVFLALPALAMRAGVVEVAVGEPSADERSIFDVTRFQIGVGLNREVYSGPGPLPEPRWVAGVYGSWNLVPWLDVVGRVERGVDAGSDEFRLTAGVRAVIWRGVK